METSEILDKAADEMMIREWTRGTGGWMRGKPADALRMVCLEGALMAATGMRMRGGSPETGFNECSAMIALKRHMNRTLPAEELIHTGYHVTFEWNDRYGDQDRAIELLRGAAKHERECEAKADARTA